MIVVADASPLNYLIQIQCDALLEELYDRVFIPTAVLEELRHPRAPVPVASWLLRLPAWIEVRVLASPATSGLENLDAGEREAILLAQEIRAHLLLIDDKEGRAEAKLRSLQTIGTLGVLLVGARNGLLDPKLAFQRLIEETTFRASPELKERFLMYCSELRK